MKKLLILFIPSFLFVSLGSFVFVGNLNPLDEESNMTTTTFKSADGLSITADVFYIELDVVSFDDVNSGLEAPSLPPILATIPLTPFLRISYIFSPAPNIKVHTVKMLIQIIFDLYSFR